MKKICSVCGRKLQGWNNEGICSQCRQRSKNLINVKNKFRNTKDITMYDTLKELESSVIEYGNTLMDDDLKIEDIAISLIRIVENVDFISHQCRLNLNLYIDKFYEKDGVPCETEKR